MVPDSVEEKKYTLSTDQPKTINWGYSLHSQDPKQIIKGPLSERDDRVRVSADEIYQEVTSRRLQHGLKEQLKKLWQERGTPFCKHCGNEVLSLQARVEKFLNKAVCEIIGLVVKIAPDEASVHSVQELAEMYGAQRAVVDNELVSVDEAPELLHTVFLLIESWNYKTIESRIVSERILQFKGSYLVGLSQKKVIKSSGDLLQCEGCGALLVHDSIDFKLYGFAADEIVVGENTLETLFLILADRLRSIPTHTDIILEGVSELLSNDQLKILDSFYKSHRISSSAAPRIEMGAEVKAFKNIDLLCEDIAAAWNNVSRSETIRPEPIIPTDLFYTKSPLCKPIASIFSSVRESRMLGLSIKAFELSTLQYRCPECVNSMKYECNACQNSRVSEEIGNISVHNLSFRDLMLLTPLELNEVFPEKTLDAPISMLSALQLDQVSLNTTARNLNFYQRLRVQLAKKLCSKKSRGTVYAPALLADLTADVKIKLLTSLDAILESLSRKIAFVEPG